MPLTERMSINARLGEPVDIVLDTRPIEVAVEYIDPDVTSKEEGRR